MRFRGRRLLGVLAFSLFLLPGLPGCSGGQQDEEGLEASDDNSAGNAADDGSGGDKAADDNGGGGDNNAAASDDDSGGGTAEEGSGSGNSTENDLQEIITEMNGQNGSGSGDAAAAGGDALPQNTAQTAPANAGATPATDAGNPAPNAKAAPEAKTAEAAPAANPPPFQPGGSSAGKNLPELGSKMAYVVQKGDTLAKISQKIYGSNARWNELATLSGIPNPSRIFPGDLIYYTLDESAVTFASAYEGIQRSEEQVKAGDTLATIAKRVYGNPNAWRAIWRENDKIDNPDVIPPGTAVYYVSQGAASAAVTKLQAEMAKLASVKATKGSNLTTKATAKGSHAVAKNNVVSNVKHAKVQKDTKSVLLADSQYFSGKMDFGTNEGNRLVVFN